MNTRQLQLYLTMASPCGYYSDRSSQNLVPDPQLRLTMPLYSQLIQQGFRRSGAHCYRPHCRDCQQGCIACRLPVQTFKISRSQKRCLTNNQDIKVTAVPASYNDEYFDLYRRYLNTRHIDGSMTDPAPEDYRQFLYSEWSETHFLECRLHGQLVALAVTDIVSDGVSAVYSFFDPEMKKNSLGTFCILQQLHYAKSLSLDYVYLGYWIKDHKKMHYKSNFKPLQIFHNNRWCAIEHAETQGCKQKEKPDI